MKENYDRNIAIMDEPHSPVSLDSAIHENILHNKKFLHPQYASSYFLQMLTISKLPNINSIFEIGPGECFCARNLRLAGYDYETFDFLPTYSPTYLGDWDTFDAKAHPKRYDLTCAFQVFEHFPWEKFHLNTLKLTMLSKKYVFISLPYSCFGVSVETATSFGQGKIEKKLVQNFVPLNLPQRRYRKAYIKEFPWAVHHWEIGRQGVSVENVIEVLKRCNLQILDKFHSPNPYHYFILCSRL